MASGAALALLLMLGCAAARAQYVGKPLGALSELHHGVRGRVFAVDSRTLYIQDFHYDGEGPAAYFYVGKSGRPSAAGAAGAARLRDERGGAGPLRRYAGEGLTLALPEGLSLRDLRWFAVWCDEYSVNFGDVSIPRELEYPRPARVGALRGVHGVQSDPIVVVDAQTLLVPNFSYDGEAPDAKFWVGRGEKPSPQGIRIPDENGKEAPLRKYDKKTIVLTLPGELTVFDIGHFAVWCEAFTVNFGHVALPRAQLSNVPPSLKMLGVSPQSRNRELAASSGAGGAGQPASRGGQRLTALPATTYRPHLRAGPRPAAAAQPHAAALRRRDDSQPTGDPELQQQQLQYHQITQPYQQFYQPFQNVNYQQLSHEELLLRQRLLDDQRRLYELQLLELQYRNALQQSGPERYRLLEGRRQRETESGEHREKASESKLNCEVLLDELAFEVRWAVAGDSVVLQLVAKLEDGEYMSFGISGDAAHSQMVGADVAVAWVDKQTLKGYAQDYYLDAKSQCAGVRGSCPDERLGEKTNSIRLLNAALVNGYSIVTYQRSLRAADELDRPVLTNASQPVVWALGPLNSRAEVSYHHHFTKGDRFIEFGRPPFWNCPMPEGEDEPRATTPPATRTPPRAQEVEAKPQPTPPKEKEVIKPNPVPTPRPVTRAVPWEIPGIQCHEPADGVFYAQMGPTGGKQGYSAITGHVGWGISWYVNGLLIPEITVVRGKKYTFVVEGGSDPEVPARYHPFYITNDPVGGYYHKSDEERKGVEIYAGVRRARNGELVPTGVGRLCNWTPDTSGPEADEFPSFGAYQRSLTLVCEEGNPGVVTWTPDNRTPDTVYYQCFTHRYLGWKINVVDECDYDGEGSEGQESRLSETVVLPDDLQQEESIQVATRVSPDSNFLDRRKKVEKIINTKTNDFSSDKGSVLTGERPEFEVVSRGQIRDVIEAVEDLESRMKQQRNSSSSHQYLVHEEPERPVREGDEYTVQPGPSYFLPAAARPLTLQAVLRPRHPPLAPYRRPAPPEIKIRQRPSNFPLPMPPPHGKKPYKPNYNRPPQLQNRPPMTPMKPMPHSKPYMPPKQVMKPGQRPQISQMSQGQSIVMGKPSQQQLLPPGPSHTLNLGRTDVIANQVVRSQITLPGSIDSMGSSSAVRPTFLNQPGQIILGKPMDHPVPLDQQMMPTRHHVITAPPPEQSPTTPRARPERPTPPQGEIIKSSDFIGESTDPPSLHPAVNTGFKPNTIVIESGFKPIIREPLMDRIGGDYETSGGGNNRREDTDVEEDYDESPQPIGNTNHAYNTPSDKITESFEPMFIPSPPDLHLPTVDRTKEVFPKNHAKEDRPHPVYVKTESELNALFSKKNMEKEVPSDMAMESDRVSPQYLPPDPKLPKEHSQKLSTDEETFTTYDGKIVSAATLTSVSDSKNGLKLFSSKLPANTELLLKSPQFGPFKGEIPPAIAGAISKADSDEESTNERTTHLKLVNTYRPDDNKDELIAEGSDNKEVIVEKEETKDNATLNSDKPTQDNNVTDSDEEYEDEEAQDDYDSDMKARMRQKRDLREIVGKTFLRYKRGANNQIDFQVQATTSSSTALSWTNLLILPLLLEIF